jgi:hypothetical protein
MINLRLIITYTLVFSFAYLFGPASVNAGGEFMMMDWINKGRNQKTKQQPVLLTKEIKDHPTKEISDQPTKSHLREEELQKLDDQLKALEKRRFELAASGAEEGEEIKGMGETGTDPRDFSAKFMPYFRFTELENELEQKEFVLFGLIPFSKKIAMTYEIPVAMERNIRDTDGYKTLSDIGGGGAVLPGGLPLSSELDGKETGIGDMNLRFFVKHDCKLLGFDFMSGVETVLPTASEDVLGSETFIVKPMAILARDLNFWPAPGAFLALMNFYAFDAWKDSDRDSVSQYIGRYFFMLPVHPSGIYLLPEIQYIYDFELHHNSFWIGPEIGKMLAPGRILYLKPGFGINPSKSKGDRNWTFEIGFRYFF